MWKVVSIYSIGFLNIVTINVYSQRCVPLATRAFVKVLGCLLPWAWPWWSWMSERTWNQPSYDCWTTLVTTTLPRNQALGASLLAAYSWLSMALVLAKMFLDVQKNLKPTQFYLLNNLCFNNFAQKSSPGGVLALCLLLAVYGHGPGPDGPGCPEKL